MSVFDKIFAQVKEWATYFVTAGPLVATIALLWQAYQHLPALLQALADHLENATNFFLSSSIGSYLGQANRVVPLTEIFQMMSFLVGLKVLAFGYRMVRKIIPFL